MISFFKNVSGSIIAVDTDHKLENSEIEKLKWLFNDAQLLDASTVEGKFVGPRREMITPLEYERGGNNPEHGSFRS